MPTNHTTNYQLSQWERTDKVQMEDFNADNAKIDAALAGHEGRVAALEQQVPLLGNCRVTVYQYVGNGKAKPNKTVIPFIEKPLAIIVVASSGDFALMMKDGTGAQGCHYVDSFPIETAWSNNHVEMAAITSQMQMNETNISYCALMFLPPKI